MHFFTEPVPMWQRKGKTNTANVCYSFSVINPYVGTCTGRCLSQAAVESVFLLFFFFFKFLLSLQPMQNTWPLLWILLWLMRKN